MHCDVLTLYTSEDCNLNCSYCEIAKSKAMLNINDASERNKKIKQAMLNGTFLNNILKACENLQINKNDVKNIDLWGQEPTMTIKEFITLFKELIKEFLNLESLFFSTNGVGYIEDLLNFIKEIDKLIGQELKEKFELRLQFSYDGEYSTKNYRGINPEIIVKNIEYFLTSLNDIQLKNITIRLSFHNVISRNLMKKLLKEENKVYGFWKELYDLSRKFQTMIKNPKVKASMFAPGIETPVNASREDGILFYNFLLATEEVCNKLAWDGPLGLVHQNLHCLEMAQKGYRNYYNLKEGDILIEDLDNYIQYILYLTMLENKEENNRKMIEAMSEVFCVAYRNGLKIRYNGDYVHCQNALHQLDENNMSIESLEQINAKFMAKKKYYPNVTKKEEIKDYEKKAYQVSVARQGAFCYNFLQSLNLMNLLLESGQVSENYKKDRKKMLRHAFYMTYMDTCMDDCLKLHNSLTGRHAGVYRFYCNGYLDKIEEYTIEKIKKNNYHLKLNDTMKPEEEKDNIFMLDLIYK